MIGGQWDISWHRSIGRDTFWTPAHMAIYMCGIMAGLSCGYLILATTFGNSATALHRRENVGIPSSPGRLYRGLGRRRHADLRAVR